ncbi:MAG TPA: hypothetical protein VHV49_12225 [Pseudonocardiaceae bacterium]|jgi:hypothetical protein|nr:hypothetical protein [Pseudonocardiaceae bacterium]
MALRKLAISVAGTLLLAGAIGVLSPGVASATPEQAIGRAIAPAQPYHNNPDKSDWLGSYLVNGQRVWCIDFALAAPEPNEQYTDGATLETKWGTAVNPTIAAEISYLLLRYGNTTSPDDAAALAHLLHSWTAAPRNPSQLDPANDFRHIAYDVNFHLSRMTAATKASVAKLQADASANHGPWTESMAAPTTSQVIGTAGDWTVNVHNTAGKGLADVPVTITATDATLAGGSDSEVVNTPADGGPLVVAATPTGPNPKLVATLDSPAPMPKVRVPVRADVQKVVTTGGTTVLTTTRTTTANTPSGNVTVTKTDAHTKAPIPGVTLELTGPDKRNPAIASDGRPLTGSDGKPIVLTTGVNGTATQTGLHTPQEVCFVETAPPPGYDQAFNPKSPPTVCGQLVPGATLKLSLTNVPNKVPVAIPAGGPPTLTATSTVLHRPAPTALVLFGGLLVIVAGCVGLVTLRRASRGGR